MANDEITKQVDDLLQVDHFDEDTRRALLDLGPEARNLLRDYATGSYPSGDPDIQGRAILVLGESRDPDLAVPALRTAMASPDTDIRVRAMRSLGRVGGSEATAQLRECVQEGDVDDAERTHGIRALATINTAEAKASLEALDSDRLAAPVAEELSDALHKMSP
jgi:HEAT repeat protein